MSPFPIVREARADSAARMDIPPDVPGSRRTLHLDGCFGVVHRQADDLKDAFAYGGLCEHQLQF